ncbi:hypothetical protein [Actinokineospora terrae]|uniref:Uncharacterized protein n=1 Tax=Actinokineospora terrae TaxID=155974 RepID=A0A1H9KDB9_9PSEU|nr:hypothetical protein [Actinokineospora terrae]SEQ96895.1 hypothetical protein SAMN04487818_101120 [Actinokineospora terrae]
MGFEALIRDLAESTGHAAAYYAPDGDGLTLVASWPGSAAPADRIEAIPGVVERVPSGGAVALSDAGPGDQERLRRTAHRIALLAADERLRAERERLTERVQVLEADARAARERLAEVRDLERRRIAGALTSVTTREFTDLRSLLADLDHAGSDTARALTSFRTALDDVIDRFRTVVRGVHPAMLPERGPLAALEELAADLPRPVHFAGDLGRRVGWEVESGIYHAAAAVMSLLAEGTSHEPVGVALSRANGALTLTFTDSTPRLTAAELRGALKDDADRLAAFGGVLDTWVANGRALVRIWLPERLDGTAVVAPAYAEGTLLARVRDLVTTAVRESVAGWAEIADRLDQPPTVALVDSSRAVELLTGYAFAADGAITWYVHGRTRDVTFHRPGLPPVTTPVSVAGITRPADADRLVIRWPADILRHMTLVDVPALPTAVSGYDVVVLSRPDPTFLRTFRDKVDIIVGTEDLPSLLRRRVIERADLITARSVLAAARRAPRPEPLARLLDRIEADAHELAELALLNELETGLLTLPIDAERLLGANGRAPHIRLGLPATAPLDEIHHTATTATAIWRTRASNPATSPHHRDACLILVRTCEGLSLLRS